MLLRRRVVIFLATGGYIGRVPTAPGTFGTLLGLPLAFVLSKVSWIGSLAIMLALILAAVWSAGEAARHLGDKDPGCIVIDEIAGMAVALLGMPFTPVNCLAGFILFRLFDIVKPPPVRQLDRNLGGGWGIVLDDIAAGVLTNIVLRIGGILFN